MTSKYAIPSNTSRDVQAFYLSATRNMVFYAKSTVSSNDRRAHTYFLHPKNAPTSSSGAQNSPFGTRTSTLFGHLHDTTTTNSHILYSRTTTQDETTQNETCLRPRASVAGNGQSRSRPQNRPSNDDMIPHPAKETYQEHPTDRPSGMDEVMCMAGGNAR